MFGPSSYLIVIVCLVILIPIIYKVGRRESALADVLCLACTLVIGFCLYACWNAVKPQPATPVQAQAASAAQAPTAVATSSPAGESKSDAAATPSASLDAQWEEVAKNGNTFSILKDPPQGGYWVYKILPDQPKPITGKELSVDHAGKVRLFKVVNSKAGSYLEFDVTAADIPPTTSKK